MADSPSADPSPTAPSNTAGPGAAPPAPRRRRGLALHTQILLGLVLGAALGLTANYLGQRPVPADAAAPTAADPLDQDANRLDDRVEWVAANLAEPLGKVFLRLVIMVVVPLVVSALALGVLELGDVRHLGRVGLRTLGYTALLSVTAVMIGVSLVNLLEPGKALAPEKREQLRAQYADSAGKSVASAAGAKSISQTLLDIIPENPLQEMVGAIDGSSKGNGMLSVMFFALVLGVALAAAPKRTETLVRLLEGTFDVAMTVIQFAMRIAPAAVACLVFAITARLGIGVLTTLGWFVGTVLLGLALQMFGVYSLALWFLAGRRPGEFFRATSEATLTAFGTSSSNATLPTSLRVAQERLHLPREIAQFVLTVGATGNQNGTALFEGVVVLFLAQVFGVELTLMQQVSVVLMSVLAGVGTAGVPGGSIPLIVVVLRSVGVPGEGIAIILGVDRLLDMCRTTLNVTGDLVLATCVAAGERPRR